MKTKLEKKKFLYVNTDVFNCDTMFFVNYTIKDAIQYCKKSKGLEEGGQLLEKAVSGHEYKEMLETDSVLGRMVPLEKGYAVFLKFYQKSWRMNTALLVHELVHVANWMLEHRQIPLVKETDEVYAYLVESLYKGFVFKYY